MEMKEIFVFGKHSTLFLDFSISLLLQILYLSPAEQRIFIGILNFRNSAVGKLFNEQT